MYGSATVMLGLLLYSEKVYHVQRPKRFHWRRVEVEEAAICCQLNPPTDGDCAGGAHAQMVDIRGGGERNQHNNQVHQHLQQTRFDE